MRIPDISTMGSYRRQHAGWQLTRGGRVFGQTEGLVSVVTITYNSAATLARTMESVIGQTYPAVEYILVDGASKDGTVTIIRSFEKQISLWTSAPDNGISNAFNKGLSLATGEYIAILNADDWMEQDNLKYAVETLTRTGAGFVFGDQVMHRDDGLTFVYLGDPNYSALIARRMPQLNHPTVTVRRDVYEACGLFAENLRYAMDYELLLRFHRAGIKGAYDPRILGHMALSGASDRSYLKGLAECRDISRFHGLPIWAAWMEYFYSVTKASVRRRLQKVVPQSLINGAWKLVNPRFASTPPKRHF